MSSRSLIGGLSSSLRRQGHGKGPGCAAEAAEAVEAGEAGKLCGEGQVTPPSLISCLGEKARRPLTASGVLGFSYLSLNDVVSGHVRLQCKLSGAASTPRCSFARLTGALVIRSTNATPGSRKPPRHCHASRPPSRQKSGRLRLWKCKNLANLFLSG